MDRACRKCGEIKSDSDFYRKSADVLRTECKSCTNKQTSNWRRNNPDKARQIRDKHIKSNPEKRKKIRLDYYQSLKAAAIDAYGSACACCGESEPRFLAFDHINNDGAEQRKRDRISGGLDFLRWLKRNEYPGNIQVLCHNCNVGKHLNGGVCPHEQP